MRIGIDATCWANQRGFGRFTREIVSALVQLAPEHEFVCLLDRRAAESFTLNAANVRAVIARQRVSPTQAAAANGFRSPVDMLRLSAAVRRERVDAFFSPAVYSYFPLPPGLPSVVTIHDAIAERYPALTLPSRRARLFWRLKVGLALKQARVVLTVSDFAADEIAAVHGVPRAQLRVALEAPAAAYHPSLSTAEVAAEAQRIGLPAGARWITYVGGFNPHKNLDALIRAHQSANARLATPIFLVLIGATDVDGFYTNVTALRALIAERGTGHVVLWTGFLPDERIRHLHSGAIALALPSQSEGFGLPAIEAAACGTPVIATTASPLPSLLEGGGLFVDPGDERALAEAIVRLATDEPARRQFGAEARRRAAALSWPRAARTALDALLEAAA